MSIDANWAAARSGNLPFDPDTDRRREVVSWVDIQGLRADFPSLEIIRDMPLSSGGSSSNSILRFLHEPGGVINLYECCTSYEISG
jgi:hypothetical protein